MTWAFEHGHIPGNPAVGVRVPGVTSTAERWTYLSLDEVELFTRKAAKGFPVQDWRLLQFALYTGCRSGEVFNMLRADVNLRNGTILVARGFNGPTKSGRSRRIPIFAPLLPILKAQLAETSRSTLLFPNRYGRRRKRSSTANLRKHLDHVGITRKLRFHDIRHTCASMLVSGSWGQHWTLAQIGSLLGHSSAAVTDRYSHCDPSSIITAAKTLRF